MITRSVPRPIYMKDSFKAVLEAERPSLYLSVATIACFAGRQEKSPHSPISAGKAVDWVFFLSDVPIAA
jgi:hypothetical protein